LRRLLLGLIVLVGAVVTIVWMAAKHEIALYGANKFLNDKNVSIESISGNFLSTIEIQGIRYNERLAIKDIACQYNLWGLLAQTIDIKSCRIDTVDINTTMALGKAFASGDTNQSSDKEETKSKWHFQVGDLNFNAFYDAYKIELQGNLKENIFRANLLINTPQIQKIKILSHVDIALLSYKGEIRVEDDELYAKEYGKLVEDLVVDFQGDLKRLETTIDSKYLKGSVVSQEFNHTLVTLFTKEAMPLRGLVPKELEKLELNFVATSSLHLQGIKPIYAYIDLKSNAANLRIDGEYDKDMDFNGSLDFPKDSLLHNYDPKLHLNKFGKIALHATLDANESISATVKAKRMGANLRYKQGQIDSMLYISSQNIKLKGDINKSLHAEINIASIRQLLRTIKPIYELDTPRLRGELFANVSVANQKDINLSIRSKRISLSKQEIKNIRLNATSNIEQTTIKGYQFDFDKLHFFATKPAILYFKDQKLTLDSLWLNDQLSIKGAYDLNGSKGEFDIKTDNFSFSYPQYIDTAFMSDLKLTLDANRTDISGVVTLKGGEISYKPDTSESFSLDKDIIIKQKKSKKSPDTLTLSVALISQKPLVYKTKEAQIQAFANFQVTKEFQKELKVYGSVQFVDWHSYYILQNKKIRLRKQSSIHFIGNPTMPNIDIKAYYKGLGAEIEITVVGDPQTPVLNFTSSPTMSKEQILSLLLLDTPAGADLNRQEDLQYLLGGALAKSLLSNIGLRVDHFVISENAFEIGKKIGDKITIIYLADEVSSVKVVYDYSKKVEADFIINKESSSMDIYYKGSF